MTLLDGGPARAAGTAKPLRVLVSGVASDAHSWNLVYLQLRLEEMGHEVVNTGPCAPDRLVLDRCRALHPDLVVVSSVNGHGMADGVRLVGLLRRCAELRATPMVIGGKLGIRGPDDQHADRLLAAGFDAVFEDGGGLLRFESFVRRLLPVGGS